MEEKRIFKLYFNKEVLGTFYGNNVACLIDLLSKERSQLKGEIVVKEVDKNDSLIEEVGRYDENGWASHNEEQA